MFDGIKWEDFGTVYERMQGLRLLEAQALPGTAPGHILSMGVIGRSQRRRGVYRGPAALLRDYAAFKGMDEAALCGAVESYWRDCGHWLGSAATLIERVTA